MDIVLFSTKGVESALIHLNIIDIELFVEAGKVRAFLSRELAMELINRMLIALSTPFKEEEDQTVK